MLKATIAALPKLLKAPSTPKARYMEMMALLYDIPQKARKEGLDVDREGRRGAHKSPLFKKYPNIGSDHHVVEFITDYPRT